MAATNVSLGESALEGGGDGRREAGPEARGRDGCRGGEQLANIF